jgi:hypothetical protein
MEDAAAAVGISPASAYRWLQDGVVLEHLAQARRESMKAAMSRLQENATRAADNLDQLQLTAESEAVRLAHRGQIWSSRSGQWKSSMCSNASTHSSKP